MLALFIYELTIFSVFLCLFYRRPGEPPLVNGWIPFLGKALDFRKDASKFLLSLQQKYGDVFTVHIAGEKRAIS